MSDLAAAATTLRGLHVPFRPLVLANIWDAGSAKLAEAAGFPAIATSSGAVAESLGYADGQQAPVDEMLAAAARITRVAGVPVTVDAEAGYGLSAVDLVGRLITAGVAGCNLEDSDHGAGGLVDPRRQTEWLGSVREAAERAGVPIVINARVDSFIRRPADVPEADMLADAIDRARAYIAAGADCVYPIGMRDADVVRRLVAELAPVPVNVLPLPGGSVADVAALGVARVSMGTALWREAKAALTDRLTGLSAN